MKADRHIWNSEIEVGKFLSALIEMTGAKTVIEIGVFEGETTQAMLSALPSHSQFIGIDIQDHRTDAAKKAMQSKNKSIDFILSESLISLKQLPKKHFDLIFVDGNHEWNYVLPEFKIIEGLISDDGIIVYHDSIHMEGPREIIKYARHYGYDTVVLNTPEVRGLGIIKKRQK